MFPLQPQVLSPPKSSDTELGWRRCSASLPHHLVMPSEPAKGPQSIRCQQCNSRHAGDNSNKAQEFQECLAGRQPSVYGSDSPPGDSELCLKTCSDVATWREAKTYTGVQLTLNRCQWDAAKHRAMSPVSKEKAWWFSSLNSQRITWSTGPPAQRFGFSGETQECALPTSCQVMLLSAGPGTVMEDSWSGVSVKASPRE